MSVILKNKILEIENLSVELTKKKLFLLQNIFLSLEEEESLAIIGESGSGKTMLAKSIMGILPQSFKCEGDLFLFNQEWASLIEKQKQKKRGTGIAMIFQDPNVTLNPYFTIGFQIMETLPMELRGKDKVLKELEKVGFIDVERIFAAYPHQLSGGEKQRVLIALALSNNPKILIADEPFASLDLISKFGILELLMKLKKERKFSLIFISHDLSLALKICSRTIVMYAGRIVEDTPSDLIKKNRAHPYTEGLFNSLLSYNEDPTPIEGVAPSILDLPQGCSFHPRCSKASEICLRKTPEMKTLKNGQKVACHLYE